MIRAYVVASMLILFPGRGNAAIEQSLSLGGFLKSLTALYVTSEECKNISYLNSESYAGVIKAYLTRYYGDSIPYWALPEVQQYIANRQQCIDSMQFNLIMYHVYSEQFAQNYPGEPRPPNLPELYSTQTYTPQYRVTAPIITGNK